MQFEMAMKHLREGAFIHRPSWDSYKLNRHPHIYFDKHIDHSLSCLVYTDDKITIRHRSITSEDLLATDWEILKKTTDWKVKN